MGRILKYLLVLAVIGLIALTGYSFVADLSPQREPVTLSIPYDPA